MAPRKQQRPSKRDKDKNDRKEESPAPQLPQRSPEEEVSLDHCSVCSCLPRCPNRYRCPSIWPPSLALAPPFPLYPCSTQARDVTKLKEVARQFSEFKRLWRAGNQVPEMERCADELAHMAKEGHSAAACLAAAKVRAG